MATNKVTTINTISFYLFIFLIFSYQKDKMFFYNQEIILNYFNYAYAPILLCIIGLSYFLIYKKKTRSPLASDSVNRFVLLMTFLSFFMSTLLPMKSIITYIYISMLYLIYNYSTLLPKIVSNTAYSRGFIILFLLLLYVYFSGYSEQIVQQMNDTQTNSSYTILYLLPLLLCIKNKGVNILSLIITLIVVFTSLKRGGIISFLFGLITYLYVKYISLSKSSSNNKVINILLFFVIIGCSILLMFHINSTTEGIIFDRFNSISDDEGSGRIDIWKRVMILFSNSSILTLLFGNGWDAVYHNLGISAHNDFLEILYDFGLFSFVLYLLMLYRLYRYTKILIRNQSDYAPVLACSLAIFITNSIVSHIVIYPHYFTLFLITWGYIISSTNNHLYAQIDASVKQ